MPKTPAERVREYRARKKLLKPKPEKPPAQTPAERNRKYRARLKALRNAVATIGENETPLANLSCELHSVNPLEPSTSRNNGVDRPKTSTERVQDYRARKKLLELQKPPAQTSAQRTRKYRARLKALKNAVATIGENESSRIFKQQINLEDVSLSNTKNGNFVNGAECSRIKMEEELANLNKLAAPDYIKEEIGIGNNAADYCKINVKLEEDPLDSNNFPLPMQADIKNETDPVDYENSINEAQHLIKQETESADLNNLAAAAEIEEKISIGNIEVVYFKINVKSEEDPLDSDNLLIPIQNGSADIKHETDSFSLDYKNSIDESQHLIKQETESEDLNHLTREVGRNRRRTALSSGVENWVSAIHIQKIDEENQIDEKLQRKRELTKARVKKYRTKKQMELQQQDEEMEKMRVAERERAMARERMRRFRERKRLKALKCESSMQNDASEEMEKIRVQETTEERKKALARERMRRFRERKRLNALKSDSQTTLHDSLMQNDSNEEKMRVQEEIAERKKAMARERLRKYREKKRLELKPVQLVIRENHASSMQDNSKFNFQPKFDDNSNQSVQFSTKLHEEMEKIRVREKAMARERMRRFRERKRLKALKCDSSMQNEPSEELEKIRVQETTAERKKALARERMRRFRERKRLNTLKSDSQISLHDSLMQDDLNEEKMRVREEIVEQKKAMARERLRKYREKKRLELKPVQLVIRENHDSSMQDNSKFNFQPKFDDNSNHFVQFPTEIQEEMENIRIREKAMARERMRRFRERKRLNSLKSDSQTTLHDSSMQNDSEAMEKISVQEKIAQRLKTLKSVPQLVHNSQTMLHDSSMKNDLSEEMEKIQVREKNVEREKAMARERMRRFRERKRLDALKSIHQLVHDSQTTLHHSSMQNDSNEEMKMEKIPVEDKSAERKKAMARERLRRYREKKRLELKSDSSMQDDPSEEMEKMRVREQIAEREKAMARERLRRFREKKRLNALKSDSQTTLHDSSIAAAIAERQKALARERMRRYRERKRLNALKSVHHDSKISLVSHVNPTIGIESTNYDL